MDIRFASIPKCASRSLKALGLLGEVEGRCHTKITEYPDWHKYRWVVLDRPDNEWLESWWGECQGSKSMFGQWLGFEYKSLAEDLERLQNPPEGIAPRRPGVNQWVPENFSQDFKSSRLSFKDYAIAVITDGVPYERMQLVDLDNWLVSRGITPLHENCREANAVRRLR